MTFWDHLDVLRRHIWRMLLAALVAMVACFCFKETLFAVVLYPKPDFLNLINVDIAQQFLIHMRVALLAGLLLTAPYLIYELFAFVAPGLYAAERRVVVRALLGACLLFYCGVALNYFIIFPFTVRFLGSYQVSGEVQNLISLTSYVDLLMVMSFVLGVVFELPVLCWLLAKMGILKPQFMSRYRRHAIVVIVIVGAIITPTGDPFTLSLVSVPIYLLYELSILIVKKTAK
ncbi:MAG: twin-arginine translocase subunit TatC [Bacteroidales bacterium]|nr:twin-arginine translocase subunit TatC [Bacteroidales bacterium]